MKAVTPVLALIVAIPLCAETAHARGSGGGFGAAGGFAHGGGGVAGGGFAHGAGGFHRGAFHGSRGFARGAYPGGGYRGGYGYRGYGYRGYHYGRHYGWYGPGVSFSLGWPWYGWPYYDPYYTYYPSYYYAPSVVVGSEVAAAPPLPAQHWYYCDDPTGYYPYVPSCNHEWQVVAATPPSATGPARDPSLMRSSSPARTASAN